jgi:PTS system trehalose-specific IIC component
MSIDYRAVAVEVLARVGHAGNIVCAAHCITRLRIAVHRPGDVDVSQLASIELVKGAFFSDGILHIVIGAGDVDRVYAAMLDITGLAPASVAEVKVVGVSRAAPLQRLVRVFSDVFMPILPAIVVSGLLMGVNNLLGVEGLLQPGQTLLQAWPQFGGVWDLINMMANTSFVFLPVLVGWSAAKRFGGSEVLGIVLGLLLVHPALLNAWDYGRAVAHLDGMTLPVFDLFGFQIEKVGYQGQILPTLVATWVMSRIELWLRARVPNAIQLLVVPISSILLGGALALIAIGPVTRGMGNLLAEGVVQLFEFAPVVGALLFGLLYAPLVVTGMHHLFIAIDLQLIASQGGALLWPMVVMSNLAQGSAALGIYVVARHAKERSMASASTLSAYFGITEPAMFGVNLRYKFPFYMALIGSAAGAIFITLERVRATAIGIGGLPAFISIVPAQIPPFIIGMLIALILPVLLTWLFVRQLVSRHAHAAMVS